MLWQQPLLHLSKSVQITRNKSQKKMPPFHRGLIRLWITLAEKTYLPCQWASLRLGVKGQELQGVQRDQTPQELQRLNKAQHLQWFPSIEPGPRLHHQNCAGPPEVCVSALAANPGRARCGVGSVHVLLCVLVWWSCCPTRPGCGLTVCEEMWCLKGSFDALSGLHVALWACAGRLLNIVPSVLEIASWARQWGYYWAGRGDIGWALLQEVFSCSFLCHFSQRVKIGWQSRKWILLQKCHPQN